MEAARFIRRLNRFVVECEKDGNPVKAYLPNPGRLWELLLPGRKVWIKPSGGKGKLTHTLMAVEKNGYPVMLHTHLTNSIVERLLSEGRIPGYEDYGVERREVNSGGSRIDFLLSCPQKGKLLLEVKTCTLFGNILAMFPDAETSRGVRHIRELVHSDSSHLRGSVLFVVQWPHARFFMPDVHVDIEFARALLEAKDRLDIRAVALEYPDLTFTVKSVKKLDIPWDFVADHAIDAGCYILLVTLSETVSIKFGSGSSASPFPAGFYIYIGRAKKGLKKRLSRHGRKNKKLRWHIDYLTERASRIKALPIRLPETPECEIAGSFAEVFPVVPGFGASDCRCESHLFYSPTDPITNPSFIDRLMMFRVYLLEERLKKLYGL
ncbi:DNA/RNA nuclease SfsA [Thermodesulforhabdus norvegica]|uniref:Sugar fermentation stimulation protein A n=1 Tax=Thermodesulforhabdus norvegica TaxID=39841 RepID=A0A1I4R971_9BACT|nr:DNA/RNA nuclease SfsA [Thermodesulforhabdus norvegica]SFM48858.1 sugar fermentation stimulation protein A [Thermodesulforhabdus norvegica]